VPGIGRFHSPMWPESGGATARPGRAAGHTSSGDHHHGEAETAIYVVEGNPVFVFAEADQEVRVETSPGDFIFVPTESPGEGVFDDRGDLPRRANRRAGRRHGHRKRFVEGAEGGDVPQRRERRGAPGAIHQPQEAIPKRDVRPHTRPDLRRVRKVVISQVVPWRPCAWFTRMRVSVAEARRGAKVQCC
jgi:hypothetical protein